MLPVDDRQWREGELIGVFERWSLQTSDGRSVYRNSHNVLGWSQELYLYFESRWKRWIITSSQYPSDEHPEYLIAQSSYGDEAVCPEAASGWQHVTVYLSYGEYGVEGGWYINTYGEDLPIEVVCEGCPVASLSSWRVFNLEYRLDEVFQQGGLREIELAAELETYNPTSFPISSPDFTFTSTASNSFSFELEEESVETSGSSTANSDSETEVRGGTGGGRRRLAAFGPALLKAAPIIANAIPVSANTLVISSVCLHLD